MDANSGNLTPSKVGGLNAAGKKYFVVIFLVRSKPARNIRIFSFPVSPVPPITDGALAPGKRGPRLQVDLPGSPKNILGLSPSYMVSAVFCKISVKIN